MNLLTDGIRMGRFSMIGNERLLTNGWQILKFSECIKQLNTGLNPRNHFSLGHGSLKYITAKNLTQFGTIDFSKCDFIDEQAKRIIHRRSDIQVGDILFSSRAPIGHCHLICEKPDDYDIGESIFSIRVNRKIILPDYLCLYMASDYFVRMASLHTTGSIIQEIRISDLMDTDVILPPMNEQRRIAECFKKIDRKIALNNKINDNLAQQAQLLFDFMFQDISGSKHIGDFIVPQRGTALLSKDAIPGDIPVVAGGLVPSTYHNAANTVAPVITISSSGANAGFVNLWGVPVWSSDSSFIDFKMTPYVYFWHALLKRHQNNIYKIQTGSAQPHIYPSHIASLPVCDLDFGKVADYTERVTPLFTLISKNYKESNQLRALRDWLLPMLMNGQATISD